jgi:hypothetical protein
MDRTKHVAAEAQNPGAVAVVEDLEGSRFTVAEVINQAVVGESGEQSPRLADANGMRTWRGSGFHTSSIGDSAEF